MVGRKKQAEAEFARREKTVVDPRKKPVAEELAG
jgi:hypothetical protein